MRYRKPLSYNRSKIEIAANGDPSSALCILSSIRDDLVKNGCVSCDNKDLLIDALTKICDRHRPEKVLGLIRPPHRPKSSLIEERNNFLALEYWRLIISGNKQEQTASRVGKRWGLGPRQTRHIAEDKNRREIALKEISRHGGNALGGRTREHTELRRKLRRLYLTRKEGK